MIYTIEQLKADTIAEVVALKQHATFEGVARLDLKTLNPLCERRCLYGQMTGSCLNGRAQDLIMACCVRALGTSYYLPAIGTDWLDPQSRASVAASKRDIGSIDYLSALEAYIHLADAKTAEIIDYLTGATETLSL
jgi:hypothetical protein